MAVAASIYALVDPDSGELRYIGKANSPASRLKTHISDARQRKRPVHHWINKLLSQGKAPDMVVIRDGCKDWKEDEKELIASGRAAGYRLLNLAEGGDAPMCDKPTRQRNAIKACKRRAESEGLRGYWEMAKAGGRAAKIMREAGKIDKADNLIEALRKLKTASDDYKEMVGLWWLRR